MLWNKSPTIIWLAFCSETKLAMVVNAKRSFAGLSRLLKARLFINSSYAANCSSFCNPLHQIENVFALLNFTPEVMQKIVSSFNPSSFNNSNSTVLYFFCSSLFSDFLLSAFALFNKSYNTFLSILTSQTLSVSNLKV